MNNNSQSVLKTILSLPIVLLGNISESRRWAYYLIIPSLLMISLIVIYPVLNGIGLSFQEKQLTRPNRDAFVGFDHYVEMFTDDDEFAVALKNTGIWVIAGTLSQFTLGLCTALALNKSGTVIKIVGVLVLLPWVMPSVVAANIWALLLDSRLGVINDILVNMGVLTEYMAWFANKDTAMVSALVVSLWRSFPFFTLLMLAGLQGIPDDYYEAASVDGASRLDKFWYITIPMLRQVIIASVILRVIGLINSPDILLILTGGGPGEATQVLSLYAFQTAYLDFDFGYAGALSVVMFVILMIFTVLYIRVSGGVTEE